MEQIVNLQVDDELAAIRGKLQSLHPGRAALLVPAENRTMRGPIAMRILRRQALDLALDLTIVSPSATVRDLASQQGLAAFASTHSYRRTLSHKPLRLTGLGHALGLLGRGSVMLATLVVIGAISAIAAGLIYLLLPLATVELVPVTERISERIEITVDPEAKTIGYERRIIPGRAVFVKAQGSEQTRTTGKKTDTKAKAEGQVTLSNRTAAELLVPAGTVARTSSGKRFATLDDTTLGTGTASAAKTNVMAVEPGPTGNVGRGEISKVEGTLELKVSVFNEQPTIGGGGDDIEAVSEEDKARLRQSLYARLEQESLQRLEAERASGEMMPKDSATIAVLREVYDRDVGVQAKALNLEMEVRANGTFVNSADVDSVIKSWTPRLQPGYYLRQDSIRTSEPRVLSGASIATKIIVDVEGLVSSRINEDKVQNAVRWSTSEDARKYLKAAFVLAEEPRVSITPDWASRALRVEVKVTTPYTPSGGTK